MTKRKYILLLIFPIIIFQLLYFCFPSDSFFFFDKILSISTDFTPTTTIYIEKFNVTFVKNLSADFSFITVPKDAPIILEWNGFNHGSIFGNNYSIECPQKCVYTDDKNFETVANMITYNFGIYPNVSTNINPDRLNVFITVESPEHRDLFKNVSTDYFNVTSTYRLDSDIVMLYDFLDPISDSTQTWDQQHVLNIISKKTNSILFMVSHCETPSKREKLVAEMQKYINITQIGDCNGKVCKRFNNCEYDLDESHYFVIAFENSVCVDYLSEKVYRLRDLIVPIILDRSILKGVHSRLNPYVIAVSDFNSTIELVNYLKFLMEDKEEYKKYFEWTKLYKKVPTTNFFDGMACKLCEIAWQNKKQRYGKIIPDIQKWWGENRCRTNYSEIYLQNLPQMPLMF